MLLLEALLTTKQFIMIIVAIFILGGILFALTGIIHVKKNRVAIIERIGEFKGIYQSGFYFFAPLLYRRVGMYRLGIIEETYNIKRNKYKITYEIVDVKKFHYEGKHDIETILLVSLNEKRSDLSDILIKRYEHIGVKFIKLEKIKN